MPDWSASTGPWLPPHGASWRSRRSLDGSRTWRASCAPPGGSTPRAPEENVDDRVLSPALRHRGRAERCGRRGPAEWAGGFQREQMAGSSAMAAARRVRARWGEHRRGACGRNLFRLALHPLPLGQRRAAGPGDWTQAHGRRRGRALERGCHSAWVDTFSFQAPGFYPKLGYEVFGELDYPPGPRRIFFQKHLEAKAGAQVYASE